MSLAVTKLNKSANLGTIFGTFSVVASSNYAAGGEVLGLQALFGMRKAPLFVVVRGMAGFIYEYDYANDKLLVFTNSAGGANAALTEHTAAAYVAGITGDTIRGFVKFPKAL